MNNLSDHQKQLTTLLKEPRFCSSYEAKMVHHAAEQLYPAEIHQVVAQAQALEPHLVEQFLMKTDGESDLFAGLILDHMTHVMGAVQWFRNEHQPTASELMLVATLYGFASKHTPWTAASYEASKQFGGFIEQHWLPVLEGFKQDRWRDDLLLSQIAKTMVGFGHADLLTQLPEALHSRIKHARSGASFNGVLGDIYDCIFDESSSDFDLPMQSAQQLAKVFAMQAKVTGRTIDCDSLGLFFEAIDRNYAHELIMDAVKEGGVDLRQAMESTGWPEDIVKEVKASLQSFQNASSAIDILHEIRGSCKLACS